VIELKMHGENMRLYYIRNPALHNTYTSFQVPS